MIKLQHKPIDIRACYEALKAPQYGGIVVFTGTVREWTEAAGKNEHTDFIEYTAYEEMAVEEIKKLAAPFESRGFRVVIVHRLGRLELMDEAVFIGVASPHRKDAFVACQQLIDELKKTVPIWKKEVDDSGKEQEMRWGK